ncbi:metallophosphoesterase [Hyphomicrobium sp. NDB2Meth4]|uniref:metallophosphoesterase n=1 Tax=Hyphomicrobium sp. NDB2Meth4 TaxID=1892846 RepID=UPI0009302297|nr:metallophosphoesterase [Hyphomicrobium sp. NDB2Meth4]
MITRRQLIKTAGAAAIGSVGFGSYALAESFSTTVTRYRLSPPGWPTGLALKLVVLTDLHACRPWMDVERIEGIVAQVNAMKPDCVLLLGDFVAGHRLSRYGAPVPHREWAGALGALKAPLGVHAVLGNHDWWEDAQVQEHRGGHTPAGIAIQNAGITLHENTCVRLAKNGQPFWLAGLGDQWAFWRKNSRGYDGIDDLPGTLAQVTDDAPLLLMVHEPDIFPKVPERVALTVAGHTHGGQVRLFGYAPVVPSKFGARYVYGHVVEDGRNLIVSGGLGCSGLPVRLGSPPEIVEIALSA